MEEQGSEQAQASGGFPTKIVVGIVIVILIIGGLLYYRVSKKEVQNTQMKSENTMQMTTPAVSQAQPSIDQKESTASPEESNVKSFVITGENYKFNPNEISVKEGDKVKITFKSVGGLHDFVIDQFGVATKKVFDGQSDTVEFTANKKGTFQFYCSVANHRAMGMVGTLTVN